MRVSPRTKPADFENLAQQQCEDIESAARSALTNDLDTVLKLQFAGGINHQVNDVISDMFVTDLECRRRGCRNFTACLRQ
jgi:hypothetical protein